MTKYAPLSSFLAGLDSAKVRLGFEEVETLLGASLPKSASDYQAWWANDPTHSQARAWLEAGWHTENLDLTERKVEFVRVRKPLRTSATALPTAPPSDPWGALADTVTVLDEAALTSPSGEVWEAEADAR